MEALEQWQTRQNGSLQRMEAAIASLQMWIIGILATSFLTLATLLLTHILGK